MISTNVEEKDLEENDRWGWNRGRDLERGQGSNCKQSLVALLCTGPIPQNAITRIDLSHTNIVAVWQALKRQNPVLQSEELNGFGQ